jgi:hypothetical protein
MILPPLVFPVLSMVSLVQEKSPRRHLHKQLFAAFVSKKFQPGKQEVNGTVILPHLVLPVLSIVSLVQGTKSSAVIATTAGNFSDENAAKNRSCKRLLGDFSRIPSIFFFPVETFFLPFSLLLLHLFFAGRHETMTSQQPFV